MIITIEQIREAIIKQEGEPETSTNPGNIRDPVWFQGFSPIAQNGVIVPRRRYPDGTQLVYRWHFSLSDFMWVPRSRAEGVAAIDHMVALHRAEGQSLTQLLARYAPVGDGNDTAKYIADVQGWVGIPDANAPLWDYVL